MAMSERNNFSNLKDLEWVHIPGVDYVIKYEFFDERYSILVTNLKEIFGENMEEDQVQQRFSELNAHAEMKTNVILRNVRKSLDMAIAGDDAILKVECFEERVRMQVQFSVNKVFLTFNFEPCLLSTHQLKSHIIVPIISHALFTHQENIALKKKLSLSESRLRPDTLLDCKKNLNDIDLITHANVPDSVVIDSFLSVQRDMQFSIMERKAISTTQRNNVPKIPTELPIKKETSELHYDEDKESLELPVKREISSQELNEVNQVCNQSQYLFNLEKTKKKKSFKF